MKIVIIEDEIITAKDLKKTIQTIDPNFEIVKLLHSIEEALIFFTHPQEVDLIFSDIQLGDGLSFEIFRKCNIQVPIIFCTAYNTYYFEAFQSTGIDYILKPFTKKTVEAALGKFNNLRTRFLNKKDDYNDLLQLLESRITPKRNAIIIRHREKIIPLSNTTIAVLYIENGCTYAYTFDQEKYLVNETLEELETDFAPSFYRANRQFLINRKAIKDVSQFFNRKMVVNLTIPFKQQILVGKMKTSSFIEWLAQH